MKFLKTLWSKIIAPASFVFSLFVVFVFLIQNANDQDNKSIVLFGVLYLFLMVIFASALIYKTKLPTALKILINYAVSVGSILLYFVIFAKNGGNIQDNRLFVIFVVSSIIFFLIAIPVLLIKSKKNKKKNEEDIYKSQFGR